MHTYATALESGLVRVALVVGASEIGALADVDERDELLGARGGAILDKSTGLHTAAVDQPVCIANRAGVSRCRRGYGRGIS